MAKKRIKNIFLKTSNSNTVTKSGNISNAIKKELNRKSFLPGTLPNNKRITGSQVQEETMFFDDSLTCVFKETSINTNIGLKVENQTVSNIENAYINLGNIDTDNANLLLKNTGIYDTPNKI